MYGWFPGRRKVELESAGASERAEARFSEEEGDRPIVKILPAAECQPGDASPTRRSKLETSAAGSRGQSRGSYVGAQFPLVGLIARTTPYVPKVAADLPKISSSRASGELSVLVVSAGCRLECGQGARFAWLRVSIASS